MPVVNTSSDLITDLRITKSVPDPARSRGRSICAAGTVTHTATDSLGSSYKLIDLPADCILDSRTAFKSDTWNMGANIAIGLVGDNDALFTGAKGANLQPVAFGDARHGLPLWQALGMAAKPADNTITLYIFGLANATAIGSCKFEIHYRTAN